MSRLLVLLLATALTGCSSKKDQSPGPEPKGFDATEREPSLAWHDAGDLGQVLTQAKQDGKMVVLDFWAKWCHSCLSMKHYVLKRELLDPIADDFIWVAIETDKPENASLLQKYPISVWPTFMFLDADGKVLMAKQGTTTAGEFSELLETAKTLDKLPDEEANAVLLASAATTKDESRAYSLYSRILTNTTPAWPGYSLAAFGALNSIPIGSHHCEHLWQSHFEQFSGVTRIDFAYLLLDCVGSRKTSDLLLEAANDVLSIANSAKDLSPDDHAAAYGLARLYYEKLKDHPKVKQVFGESTAETLAETQKTLLLAAYESAKTPEAKMTFLWPLAEVHNFLGEESQLLDAFEELAKALPTQYDPPYRVAWLYFKLEKYDQAQAWIRKAVALSYGPRKSRILALQADIAEAAPGNAKPYWQSLKSHIESLPQHLRHDKLYKKAQEKLTSP